MFYEIFPASFQDFNGDGLGDLLGLTTRLGYLQALGIGAIRLNSIFPSKNYPDHFQNVTTLMEIDDVLGGTKELRILADLLHARNMSLVLDLPIYPLLKKLNERITLPDEAAERDVNTTTIPSHTTSADELMHRIAHAAATTDQDQDVDIVSDAIRLWLSHGVDGFYIKGLENFADDPYLVENVRQWKSFLDTDQILIVSGQLIDAVPQMVAKEILKTVDLVDVYVDATKGAEHIAAQIRTTIEGLLKPGDGPYIQWSLGGVSERRISNAFTVNVSLAATLMELMLPGSPSIFYGDEIALQESHDPLGEHTDTKHLHHLSAMAWNTVPQFTSRDALPWIPHGATASFHHMDYISEMIELREKSPSIYQNYIRKMEQNVPNTSVKYSRNDIVVLERWYPRRNTFVSISNFSAKKVSLDLSAMFYGGEIMAGPAKGERILFSQFEIGPIETIVVRLDK